jgi:hypothetical protein
MTNAPAASIGGKWTMLADAGGEQVVVVLELSQDGSTFKGTMTSDHGNGTVENGKISGKTFTGILKAVIQGQPMDIQMSGTIDGDSLAGTMSGAGLPEISYTGKRSN